MSEKTTVLVTGAAGRIGSAFVAEMSDRYDFRLVDRVSRVHDLLPGAEALVMDVANLDACRQAVQDVDVVLHLAADPSPAAGYYESLQSNNFDATYNVFRAAADAGCRRVIFASSVHAVLGYPPDAETPTDAPVSPVNLYGVSKCYGEAIGRMFATSEGISAICVRIGAYQRPSLGDPDQHHELSCFVSARDLNQLFRRCIDAEGIGFAIVHGQSNNRVKRLSIEETRMLLGYEPLDDGFEVYQTSPES